MKKLCVRYCRIGNNEYFPGDEYTVEFNPIDGCLRLWNCWGAEIVKPNFINEYFI